MISLPEGHFFKVRQYPFGAFRLEIRKKRRFFGSTEAFHGYFWVEDGHRSGAQALEAAKRSVYLGWLRQRWLNSKRQEVLEIISGKAAK